MTARKRLLADNSVFAATLASELGQRCGAPQIWVAGISRNIERRLREGWSRDEVREFYEVGFFGG